jgi:hypothetical protein
LPFAPRQDHQRVNTFCYARRDLVHKRSYYGLFHAQLSFETAVRRPASVVAIPSISMSPVAGSGTAVEFAESGATMP